MNESESTKTINNNSGVMYFVTSNGNTIERTLRRTLVRMNDDGAVLLFDHWSGNQRQREVNLQETKYILSRNQRHVSDS